MPIQDVLRLADADVSEAAAFLAKTAAYVKINGPIVKSGGIAEVLQQAQSGLQSAIPNETARNALIGGGLGAAGLGTVTALQGHKKRHILNSVLAGALGGAGVGAAGTYLKQQATAPSTSISTPEEQLAAYRNKNLLDRVMAQWSHDSGAEASGETLGSELSKVPGNVFGLANTDNQSTNTQPGPGGVSGAVSGAGEVVKNTHNFGANYVANHPVSTPLAAATIGGRLGAMRRENLVNALSEGIDKNKMQTLNPFKQDRVMTDATGKAMKDYTSTTTTDPSGVTKTVNKIAPKVETTEMPSPEKDYLERLRRDVRAEHDPFEAGRIIERDLKHPGIFGAAREDWHRGNFKGKETLNTVKDVFAQRKGLKWHEGIGQTTKNLFAGRPNTANPYAAELRETLFQGGKDLTKAKFHGGKGGKAALGLLALSLLMNLGQK